ncbi:MAG: class I SAM-dependent methyltransferase [Chthoniobacterales bacterium]|nr:class I SAM-dependent methyltransferase [Chthoniobacterales bacterium]
MISSRFEIAGEDVASHYDELDHFYREIWGEHVHHGLWLRGDETREQAVVQLAELVRERALITAGTLVCDIGCGYGATSRLLAGSGADVTAMTISAAQFAVAQERHGTTANLRFILGDWLANELPPESFDAAISIESSEHMPDKPRFFQQAGRVLRREGRLAICAWLAAEKPGHWAKKWLLEPICREGRMPHLGSASEYESFAQSAGFRLEKFEDLTRRVEGTWPAIVRRLLTKFATEPGYLRFLFSRHAKNRVFAVTIPRIWLAYRVNAMRYGIFTFVKSERSTAVPAVRPPSVSPGESS